MGTIVQVNEQNLIIKKENKTYFFQYKENEAFQIKEQFLTIDGYEESINMTLNQEEIKALAKTLNHIVDEIESEDFVAYGKYMPDNIHFKARNIEEAYQWARENVHAKAEIMRATEWYKI